MRLEEALDQVTFKKYLNYSRLMATHQAKRYTEDHIQVSYDKDREMLNYCNYLQKWNEEMAGSTEALKNVITNLKGQNNSLKEEYMMIARYTLAKKETATKQTILETYSEEEIALAQKYFAFVSSQKKQQ